MKKNQYLLFLLFSLMAHAHVAFTMQESSIIEKVESYLQRHPEYVPQRNFVTAFICGDSENIVHASVQPDLTNERILQNGDVHSFKTLYRNIVIPTDNIRAVQKESKKKQGPKVSANNLAIYTLTKKSEGYYTSNPRKDVPYKPLALATRDDIITADISFEAVEKLIESKIDNPEEIFPGKAPQDIQKIMALVAVASKSFSQLTPRGKSLNEKHMLSVFLDDMEHSRTVRAIGECFAYEVYTNEKGQLVDRIVCNNLEDEVLLKDAVPFESATLAVHKDKKRLHAFIKKLPPTSAQILRPIAVPTEQKKENTSAVKAAEKMAASDYLQNNASASNSTRIATSSYMRGTGSSSVKKAIESYGIFFGHIAQSYKRIMLQQEDSQK